MSSHRATSSAKSGGAEPAPAFPANGQNHYQLLGISPQASAAELRQAFRNLSKRYHPDTTTLPPVQAREAFARLRQAYAVLADPDSRRAYDAALQRPAPAAVMVPPLPTGPAAVARPIGVRRSLSGGEWFALVLLGLALALSMVLGVGLAWARGAALITRPSWWTDAAAPSTATAAAQSGATAAAGSGAAAAAGSGAAVAAGSGAAASGAPAAAAIPAATAAMPPLPGSSQSLAPGAALRPSTQRPAARPEAAAASSTGIRQAP